MNRRTALLALIGAATAPLVKQLPVFAEPANGAASLGMIGAWNLVDGGVGHFDPEAWEQRVEEWHRSVEMHPGEIRKAVRNGTIRGYTYLDARWTQWRAS